MKKKEKKPASVPVTLVPTGITGLFLDNTAPRTNFILGAALSGGDPKAAAKLLCKNETHGIHCGRYPEGEGPIPVDCEMAECPGCHRCSP